MNDILVGVMVTISIVGAFMGGVAVALMSISHELEKRLEIDTDCRDEWDNPIRVNVEKNGKKGGVIL